MLRVDCHFHPNFPFFLGKYAVRSRARKIWAAFKKRRLDAVIVSEHAFKYPSRSFQTLMRNRPPGHPTQLIPAVEALSREGIDMIVFSRDGYVFTHKDIITPYRLSIRQLVARVHRDPRLYGVIAHPCILSDSGILHHYSERTTRRAEREARGAEKYNASLAATLAVITALHIRKLLRRTVTRIRETSCLPARLTPRGVMLLGGSDAHHVWDLGSCLLIHARRPATYDRLFRILVSPRFRRTFSWRRHRHPLLSVLADAVTSYREHLMRKLRWYRIDIPTVRTSESFWAD